MATPIRTPDAGVPAAPRPRRRRRRRAGPRWLDFSIGATALVVSAASLLVARHQAQVMDRQLAASVWPWVRGSTGNSGPNDRPFVTFSLNNRGVGPARLQSFRVNVRGRAVRGFGEFVTVCCALDTSPDAVRRLRVQRTDSYVIDRVAAAGENVDWLRLRFDTAGSPATRRAFESINGAKNSVEPIVCFCSVLDECWISSWSTPEPVHVDSCANERKKPQYR